MKIKTKGYLSGSVVNILFFSNDISLKNIKKLIKECVGKFNICQKIGNTLV